MDRVIHVSYNLYFQAQWFAVIFVTCCILDLYLFYKVNVPCIFLFVFLLSY